MCAAPPFTLGRSAPLRATAVFCLWSSGLLADVDFAQHAGRSPNNRRTDACFRGIRMPEGRRTMTRLLLVEELSNNVSNLYRISLHITSADLRK